MKMSLSLYRSAIEATIIISAGLALHLLNICIADLNTSQYYGQKADVASTLVVCSILGMLVKLKSQFPAALNGSVHRFLTFVMELCMCLLATEFLISHMWWPILHFLYSICFLIGQYIVEAKFIIGEDMALNIANWLLIYGYYMLRLGLAMLSFVLMLAYVDMLGIISGRKQFKPQTPISMARSVNAARQRHRLSSGIFLADMPNTQHTAAMSKPIKHRNILHNLEDLSEYDEYECDC